MIDQAAIISSQIEESVSLQRYLQHDAVTLILIAETLVKAFRDEKKIFLFGNGGSAADAQHIAAELSGKFCIDRTPLPALALTADSSLLTAIANDYGYDKVFVRQLQSLMEKGDVVIGISTSGNSPNVLLGIEEAKRRGATTIAFTGNAGKLRELVHHALCIPSHNTARIQEAHITAGHIICFLVEQSLFGNVDA